VSPGFFHVQGHHHVAPAARARRAGPWSAASHGNSGKLISMATGRPAPAGGSEHRPGSGEVAGERALHKDALAEIKRAGRATSGCRSGERDGDPRRRRDHPQRPPVAGTTPHVKRHVRIRRRRAGACPPAPPPCSADRHGRPGSNGFSRSCSRQCAYAITTTSPRLETLWLLYPVALAVPATRGPCRCRAAIAIAHRERATETVKDPG